MGCWFYGEDVCSNQKRCDGNGCVLYKIREKGVTSSRMEGEYRRISLKNPQIGKIPCLSFVPKSLTSKVLSL